MAYVRAWTKTMLGGLLAGGVLVMGCNFWIIAHTQAKVYSALQQVPPSKYGLVLGTSPKRIDGVASVFFDRRVEAAALLYQHGKVQYLVLSGAHDRQYYNEPVAMQKALVKLGVPEEAISLDIEGANTLASIKQAKKFLGNYPLTIITQRFHGYRALYISRYCGLNALVFAAKDTGPFVLTRTLLREFLARVKVLIDLHVLQKHHFKMMNEQ